MPIQRSTVFAALLLLSVFVPAARAQDGEMTLNVKNMPVQELMKLIAEQGGLDIAIEPGISGNVTMFVDGLAPLGVLDIVVEMLDAETVRLERFDAPGIAPQDVTGFTGNARTYVRDPVG